MRARSSSEPIRTEPGIAPSAYSSTVRTSISKVSGRFSASSAPAWSISPAIAVALKASRIMSRRYIEFSFGVTDQPKRRVRLGRIRMTAVATRISVACLNFFCLNMLAPFYCCWCHVLLDHLSHLGVLRFVGKAGKSGALCAWIGKALFLLLDKQIADQQSGVDRHSGPRHAKSGAFYQEGARR